MCPGILWRKFDGNVHIFGVVQGSFEVEAFDIGAQVAGVVSVDNTVPHEFGCGEVGHPYSEFAGYLMRLPPTVMCTRLGLSFWAQ